MSTQYASLCDRTLTMQGLSRPLLRRLSVLISVLLLFFLCTMTYLLIAAASEAGRIAPETGILLLSLCALDQILNRGNAFSCAGRCLADLSPMAVLYRRDKRILNAARAEIIRALKEQPGIFNVEHTSLNPRIDPRAARELRDSLATGRLQEYLSRPGSLWRAANLVYQLNLTHRFLKSAKI
jgi:hypothetical protein